jgi:hypothetical protein
VPERQVSERQVPERQVPERQVPDPGPPTVVVPGGPGQAGSASPSQSPLGGFDAAPDAFATPIADLLAGLLSRTDTEQADPSQPGRGGEPSGGLAFGTGSDPFAGPGRPAI